MAFNDWRPITRADILGVVSAVQMTKGAGQVRWHRFNGGDYRHVENGGYRSTDNRWLVIRVGNGQASVWESVSDEEVDNNGPGFPWLISDPYALVTNVEGCWFAQRWDSVNISDAKAEVSQSAGF